jgi:SPP1 family predicted phage head-tail adaptor
MRAGTLRHVITIKSKTVTLNTFNEEIITWSTVATVRAAIKTTGGSEYQDVEAQAASITHKVTIRYYPGLAPTMIVEWGSRSFEIEAVLDDNRQRETVLMCSEAITA